MKKILALLAIANFLTNTAAPLPKPNAQEFGILLAASGTMNFDMPLFGFNTGVPNNTSFSYNNIPASALMVTPQYNGRYIGLTFNALKGWDGTFVYEFETNDNGRVHKTGQIPSKYLKGGGLIRIIFYRDKKGDKLYEYKFMIQDLTNAK